jgi:branched-chain amino acid aminotransferase
VAAATGPAEPAVLPQAGRVVEAGPEEFFAIDGVVMPAAEARIPVLDLAFLRGVGAFDTLCTYDGHPHGMAAHLARLWDTAGRFGVAPCFSEGDLRRVVREIQARSGLHELRINIVVSPGDLTEGVFGASRPRWVVIARDQHPPPPAAYERGVTVVTCPGHRIWPEVKTTAYLCGWPGLAAAKAAGAHEAVYVDEDGTVREGVTSNVLMRTGTVICSVADSVLPGLTKAGLRAVAERHGLTWREHRMTLHDLQGADEVWITSSVRELVPVVAIDGRPVGDGTPGPWARTLRADYRDRCRQESAADAAAFAARHH